MLPVDCYYLRYYLEHFFREMTTGVQDWKQKHQRRLWNGHHRLILPGPGWRREEGELQSDSKLEVCVGCCVLEGVKA